MIHKFRGVTGKKIGKNGQFRPFTQLLLVENVVQTGGLAFIQPGRRTREVLELIDEMSLIIIPSQR